MTLQRKSSRQDRNRQFSMAPIKAWPLKIFILPNLACIVLTTKAWSSYLYLYQRDGCEPLAQDFLPLASHETRTKKLFLNTSQSHRPKKSRLPPSRPKKTGCSLASRFPISVQSSPIKHITSAQLNPVRNTHCTVAAVQVPTNHTNVHSHFTLILENLPWHTEP